MACRDAADLEAEAEAAAAARRKKRVRNLAIVTGGVGAAPLLPDR